MSTEDESNLFLELGQIIQIDAPSNSQINQHIYLIEYLDEDVIKLVDNDDLSILKLHLQDNKLTDETIESVNILANPSEKGYAKQNNLNPSRWISIHFGGDVPTIINGQITDLEEDMIEITTFPAKKKIYIDFEFKGIPKNLPIISIEEFIPPVKKDEGEDTEKLDFLDIDDDNDEDLELIIDTEDIAENVKDIFINLDEIFVGDDDLGEITEQIEVRDDQKRYGIETQTSDILDELLSNIPTNQRTYEVLNNIHVTIERFKQLRTKFSNFDEEGNAENIIKKGANYKPLVEKIQQLNYNLSWLLPIIRNKHKIYDIEEYNEEDDDVTKITFKFIMSEEMEIRQQYKMDTVPDGANKYNYLYQNLNTFFTPYEITDNTDNILDIREVKENMDVLIDNLDDFYSTMVEKNNLVRERFVIDRYNLGLKRLFNPDIRNKASKNEIIPLTSNNKLALKGFMLLPLPFLNYSRINLPNTSILDKVQLNKFNFSYLDIFTKDQDIKTITIQENPEHQDEQKEFLHLYNFNTIRECNFQEIRKYTDRSNETSNAINNSYSNFVNNIVPKTKYLFNLIKKYITNGTSYTKIIDFLEPFLIYKEDITFKQYQTIVEFIREEIIKHKRTLIQNIAKFTKYLRDNRSFVEKSILPTLVEGAKHTGDIFNKSGYNFTENISTETSLKKMIDYDNGRTFNALLSLQQLNIAQPIDIEEKVEQEVSASIGDSDKENDCKQLVLAKKYIDVEDVQKDNNELVIFDKKYDDTPYDIGDAWIEKNLHIEDHDNRIAALTEFLAHNNGIDKVKAKRDAESMVYRMKKIIDGDYAILDIGDADYKYYIRKNDIWKLDRDLTGKHADEVLFCNLKKNCIKIKSTCTNIDESKEIIKKNLLDQITKRFEDELKLSINQLKRVINEEYNYRLKNLLSLKKLKIHKKIKHDLQKIKIAQTLEIKDIIVSPYEDLRDNILSQNDIIKKYNDIIIFIDKYCRSVDINNDDEMEYWYYCIDTDIPLLPTFFYKLAHSIPLKKYKETIELIKKQRGQLSDDGDRWIDKFSGYYICNIDYDMSEGYDTTGYKILSRELMEEDVGTKLINIKEKKFNYKTELAKKIQKILKSLDRFLNISTENETDFIIRTTTDSLNKNMIEETKYREMIQRAKKQGKKKKTYEKAYDEIFILSLISSYIISVQTSIPSVLSHKTYPTCKKSFSGYPLDGNSDLSFLQYMTCILFDIRTRDRPWNIIPKAKRKLKPKKMELFVEKIKKFMQDKILSFEYVSKKIEQKKKWSKENKNIDITIQSEYNIQNWKNFLPSLDLVKVKRLENIGSQFETMLKTRINAGDFDQFPRLWNLYGKMVSYSFSIQEAVQRAINKEPLLLTTKTGVPFLENACCNEGNPNTNVYFSEKEKSIQKHNKIVYELSNLYYKYKHIYKSPLLNCNKNTKIFFPSIDKTFTKSTVYLAFIKYCKFNSGVILDDDLTRICTKNNSKFNITDTLVKKIEIMEDDDLRYSKESLNVLLNIINRRNIISYDLDPPIITEKLFLEQTIDYIMGKTSISICNPILLTQLKTLIDRFDIEIIPEEKEDDTVLLSFNKFLEKIISTQSIFIIEKMEEHGKLTNRIKDLIFEYINEPLKIKRKNKFILNWELQGDNVYMHPTDKTGLTIFTLMKEMIIDICIVYPTIIINKVNIDKRYIPKHWKISERHQRDIMKIMLKDSEDLKPFYGNKKIVKILEYVIKNSDDLILLIKTIPFYAGILGREKMSSIFNGNIVKQLGYYFLLCALRLYFLALDSDEEDDDDDDDDETREEEIEKDMFSGKSTSLAILKGQKDETEDMICSLLLVYLKKIEKYKKLLNLNAEQINKSVLKAKEKEKSKITLRLKDLTIEEREIENIMKNNSLGEWGVGKTKAIYEYDVNQYDKEREQLEKDQLVSLGLTENILELDVLENNNVQQRINSEINNLSNLPEDDDFGDRDHVDYS